MAVAACCSATAEVAAVVVDMERIASNYRWRQIAVWDDSLSAMFGFDPYLSSCHLAPSGFAHGHC